MDFWAIGASGGSVPGGQRRLDLDILSAPFLREASRRCPPSPSGGATNLSSGRGGWSYHPKVEVAG
jgi:hypothetical protein